MMNIPGGSQAWAAGFGQAHAQGMVDRFQNRPAEELYDCEKILGISTTWQKIPLTKPPGQRWPRRSING